MLPNTGSMIVSVTHFSLVWYWNDYDLFSMFYQMIFPFGYLIERKQYHSRIRKTKI